MDYSKYLQENNFDKYFVFLKKKLKNKRVLIYGAGQIFNYIKEKYDFSGINIVGICDRQFTPSQEGQEISGYKIVNFNNINKQDFDVVLVSVLKYYNLGYSLRSVINKKCLFLPLVKFSFINRLKEILKEKFNLKIFLNSVLNFLAFENRFISYFLDKKNDLHYLLTCRKAETNYKKVLEKLKKKAKKEKIKVGFVCFDSARWKCQTLYELLEKDDNFEPFIIMSKLYVGGGNQTRIQTNSDFLEKCEYFEKNHNVIYGYDLEKNEYISLDEFGMDYIFYQLPFYYHSKQMPLITSKKSLTAYVPYYIALITNETKFDTFFRACLHKYYLPYEAQKEYYSENMWNKGKNIFVSGHTSLDDFYLKTFSKKENKKMNVIYAPHHSVESSSPLKLATFMELGKFILDYAKTHPEINWVFRPHPLLKNVLYTQMEQTKVDEYYKEWEKVGTYDTNGDYMQEFVESDLLINDSGFILEYFPTGNPVIQLINPNRALYDDLSEEAINCSYKVQTETELKSILDKLLLEKDDYKKDIREDFINKYKLRDTYAAENILIDMKRELELI